MTPQDPARTRTFSWRDPLQTAQAARGLAGLDFLRKIIAGDLPQPPIACTLDYALLEVERGRAAFGFKPAEIHYNPIGMVHGGISCTLLDSAARRLRKGAWWTKAAGCTRTRPRPA